MQELSLNTQKISHSQQGRSMCPQRVRSGQLVSETKRKQVMRNLVDGLCRYPCEYNFHPLAAERVLRELTAHIGISTPRDLRAKGDGGDELLRVFGLLILDSIQLQLSQGRRSIERGTRRPTGESHEGSGPLSAKQRRQIMGLILIWFKHVWPAIKGGRAADGALSYSVVIQQCKSPDVLAELLELILPFDERPLSPFSWISHTFTSTTTLL
jgi:hypothetical protein